ncbi:hypothetical protein KKW20_03780 [Planktotalea lamellibrachiae]|nr:hypothetical protein [Aliiroseovarius lamellibrachiae]
MLILSACQSESDENAMVDPAPKGSCGAAALTHLIGQPVSTFDALGHKGPVRVIRPGQAVTMDYRLDRLNVVLDEQDVITGVNCS